MRVSKICSIFFIFLVQCASSEDQGPSLLLQAKMFYSKRLPKIHSPLSEKETQGAQEALQHSANKIECNEKRNFQNTSLTASLKLDQNLITSLTAGISPNSGTQNKKTLWSFMQKKQWIDLKKQYKPSFFFSIIYHFSPQKTSPK